MFEIADLLGKQEVVVVGGVLRRVSKVQLFSFDG